MTRCAAVFVELGERPELDRLRRCTVDRCADHPVQLDWVRGDPDRLAAYNDQLLGTGAEWFCWRPRHLGEVRETLAPRWREADLRLTEDVGTGGRT